MHPEFVAQLAAQHVRDMNAQAIAARRARQARRARRGWIVPTSRPTAPMPGLASSRLELPCTPLATAPTGAR